MKLLIIIMLSVFSISIFIFGYGFFYTKDQARLSITDFSKKRINILVPYNYKTYATSLVKVKGYTNDTIKIRGIFSMNLSGKIDTIVSRDYYGTHNIRCIFDPYKATEGELIIEYSL